MFYVTLPSITLYSMHSSVCDMRVARLPEGRRHLQSEFQTVRTMRGRAVLLRRMPNSSLEERPQEGVQAHGTERMKNLQHLSLVHEEGAHLTKEKHLNKK